MRISTAILRFLHHRCAVLGVVLTLLVAGAALNKPAAGIDEVAEDAGSAGVHFTLDEIARIVKHGPLGPPPDDPTNRFADDPRAAHLGQFLFFDTRLSANGEVSCATCHVPSKGFADGKTLAEGIGLGTRHTPSLWNVAYNNWFFWDGRADSLWAQALGPMECDVELGRDRMQIAHLIYNDTELRQAYETLFGALPDLADGDRFPAQAMPPPPLREPTTAQEHTWRAMPWKDRREIDEVFANVGKSIAAYERKIISRGSSFDTFVEGLIADDPLAMSALSDQAQRGLKLFVGEARCRLCHSGPNFTDSLFHNNRLPPLDGGMLRDQGRYGAINLLVRNNFNALGAFNDDRSKQTAGRVRQIHRAPHQWGEFKTPSLRNVALTAPYMHQGQFGTLREVLEFYSTLESAVPIQRAAELVLQPANLTDEQIDDLLAFLESLTNTDIDPALLQAPPSPIFSDVQP